MDKTFDCIENIPFNRTFQAKIEVRQNFRIKQDQIKMEYKVKFLGVNFDRLIELETTH